MQLNCYKSTSKPKSYLCLNFSAVTDIQKVENFFQFLLMEEYFEARKLFCTAYFPRNNRNLAESLSSKNSCGTAHEYGKECRVL